MQSPIRVSRAETQMRPPLEQQGLSTQTQGTLPRVLVQYQAGLHAFRHVTALLGNGVCSLSDQAQSARAQYDGAFAGEPLSVQGVLPALAQ
jgi:hypothetical protein